MWMYEKQLQYPVKIKNPSPALARVIISQLGGPHGEMGAATRYLNQRYSMPYKEVKGILTDIGTEELAHEEMVSAIVYQLTRGMHMEDIKKRGFDTYFVAHRRHLSARRLRAFVFRQYPGLHRRYHCRFNRGSRRGTESARYLRQHPASG